MTNIFLKDPDAVLDFKFDLAPLTNGFPGAVSDWLADGETITTYTLTPGDGITIDSDAKTDTDTSVTYWSSGGTAGQTYNITLHFATSDGREDDRTMVIRCRQR